MTPPCLAFVLLAIGLAGDTVAGRQTPPVDAARPSATTQTPAPSPPSVVAVQRGELIRRVPDNEFVTLRFSNRDIVTFRTTIVPRDPAERADGALRGLNRLADDGVTGPVGSRAVLGAYVVTVGGRDVFAIVQDDVDEGLDEGLPQLLARTMTRVELALHEAVEARTPSRLIRAGAWALLATLLLAIALIGMVRLRNVLQRRAVTYTEERIARSRVGRDEQLLRAARVVDVVRGAARLAALLISGAAIYTWLAFVLQQFPVTRPWGEALGGFLASTVKALAWNSITALPGLFTAALIFLATRFVIRLTSVFFEAVEQGRLEIGGISGYKAVPTRRVVTTLMWLFGIVLAYPYLPGSNTEAFKGVSVFLGLVVSLGSSGIVNQLMSGFMLTYSGAFAPGEYVRIGDVEGTVAALGVLSTKIRTPRNEEVTIPNAVVISGTSTNFTRHHGDGVLAPTVVTIGYDTPWRQVEGLLLLAAGRTAGVRAAPAPLVLQTALADFYVEYTLLVCVEAPERRVRILATLHANIQDAFNEHGVQIMSPHYEQDPKAAKVVPKEQWFDAPARRPDA